MDNVFCTQRKIDIRYDLKGSTYGRRTIQDPNGKFDHTIALKDLDFLDKNEKFRIGEQNRKRIIEIIRKDCNFFVENNIIDYSLLVGISNKQDATSNLISGRDTPISVKRYSPLESLNHSM